MESLVCFNDKFFPDWRPRFLLYQSPLSLPAAVLKVLQAEGYLSRQRAVPFPAEPLPVAKALRGREVSSVASGRRRSWLLCLAIRPMRFTELAKIRGLRRRHSK